MFKHFEKLEKEKKWQEALVEIEWIILLYPNNEEWYIRVIYLLHNILLEEITNKDLNNAYQIKLKEYFEISKNKFHNNTDYQFFIWKILYIAEWYFWLDDDTKNIKNKLAYKMQKRALELDKNNELFRWAILLSEGNINKANLLRRNILNNTNVMIWLNNYWFPWKYIINSLEFEHYDLK